MSADRPINADVESAPDADDAAAGVPEAPETDAGAPQAEAPKIDSNAAAADEPGEPAPPTPRRRKGIPGAIKLVAALVLLAVGFIVLAIVAGSGGSKDSGTTATVTTTGAAPVLAAPSEAAETGGEAESGDESGGDKGAAEAPTTTAEELGYPGFATDNTTRVGGADPATIAAASALAVFPSTTAKQRPAAVTLVPEDPRYAIPAAVMMAPPLRAPILFANEDELSPTTLAALEALGPTGSKATKGVSVFTVDGAGAAKVTTGGTTEGTHEFQAKTEPDFTVAAIAAMREKAVGEPPDAYLLTALDEPEVAAPAAAWSARSGDPVLEASGKELPPGTASVLREHPKVPVFVLGPTSSVPRKVLEEASRYGNPVKRIAGKDPVANALAFSRYGAGKFGWDVNDPGHGFVLARAEEPLAAVAASALSASGTWGPLLLTDSADTLPSEVREYFLDVKPGYTTDPTRAFYNHVWVIGDQEAIDVKQQAEVNELAELAKIGEGSEG